MPIHHDALSNSALSHESKLSTYRTFFRSGDDLLLCGRWVRILTGSGQEVAIINIPGAEDTRRRAFPPLTAASRSLDEEGAYWK